MADVNGDGVVSILDLVLAAGMFDGMAAARLQRTHKHLRHSQR